MAKQKLQSAACVHRFRDLVAVSVADGSTTYLTPKAARRLSRALAGAARSIKTERFGQSSFGYVEIDDGADILSSGRDYEESRS